MIIPTATEWFVVKSGYSVVVVDEFAELKRVHFNVSRIESCGATFSLKIIDGPVITYHCGRYRLASIKRQECACKAAD